MSEFTPEANPSSISAREAGTPVSPDDFDKLYGYLTRHGALTRSETQTTAAKFLLGIVRAKLPCSTVFEVAHSDLPRDPRTGKPAWGKETFESRVSYLNGYLELASRQCGFDCFARFEKAGGETPVYQLKWGTTPRTGLGKGEGEKKKRKKATPHLSSSVGQKLVRRYCEKVRENCEELRTHLPFAVRPREGRERYFTPLYLIESKVDGQEVHRGSCQMQEALQQSQRLFVLGNPGSGKTYLTLITAEALINAQWKITSSAAAERSQPLPILIDLRDVAERLDKTSDSSDAFGLGPLGGYFADYLPKFAFPIEYFEQWVTKGNFVFLFDRFDETDRYGKLAGYLADFSQRVGENWVVICSRVEAEGNLVDPYGQLSESVSEPGRVGGKPFWTVYLAQLQGTQQWRFLRSRLGDEDAASVWEFVNALAPESRQLAETPLFLAAFAYLHEHDKLDATQQQLYAIYETVVDETMSQVLKARTGECGVELDKMLSRHDFFDALCACATEQTDGRIMGVKTLRRLFEDDYYLPVQGATTDRNALYRDVVRESGLFPGDDGMRGPIHRTFMEFGYARHLRSRGSEGVHRLLDHVRKRPESTVPLFYVQLAGQGLAEQFLDRLDNETDNDEDFLRYANIALACPIPSEGPCKRAWERRRERVVERLFAIWKRAGDFRAEHSLRRRAARCLGLDEKTVRRKATRLRHREVTGEKETSTVDLLWAMDSHFAIEDVLHCIKQEYKNNYVRFYCVDLLGRLGDRRAVRAFCDEWLKERDWDIHMAMIEAATNTPSADEAYAELLEKARTDSRLGVRKDPVTWEAELFDCIRGGEATGGLLIPVRSIGSFGASGVEAVMSNVCPAVTRAFGGSDESAWLDATAAVVRCADPAMDISGERKERLALDLAELLDRDHATGRKAWLIARALRALLVRRSVSLQRRALARLDGPEFTYARGEIARTLGALPEPESLDVLIKTYSRRSDPYETLWNTNAIWEIVRSYRAHIERADLERLSEHAKSLELDPYDRTRYYGAQIVEIVSGSLGRS